MSTIGSIGSIQPIVSGTDDTMEQALIIRSVINDVRRDITQYDVSPDPNVLDHLALQLDILRSHLVLIGMDNCVIQVLSAAAKAIMNLLDSSTACPLPAPLQP